MARGQRSNRGKALRAQRREKLEADPAYQKAQSTRFAKIAAKLQSIEAAKKQTEDLDAQLDVLMAEARPAPQGAGPEESAAATAERMDTDSPAGKRAERRLKAKGKALKPQKRRQLSTLAKHEMALRKKASGKRKGFRVRNKKFWAEG